MKKYCKHPDYPIMYKMSFVCGRPLSFHFSDFLFSYVYSGEGTMKVGQTTHTLSKGIGWILARNERITFQTETAMQLIYIRISEEAVTEYLLHATSPDTPLATQHEEAEDCSITALPFSNHLLLQGLVSGIEAGVNNDFRAYGPLLYLKIQECLNVLTYLRPGLSYWFSRMNCLQKIDLKSFMEEHFSDNLPLEQLAQASGRSLSTFRRDFLQEFGTTPSKWLLTRRLREAWTLITEKRLKPSEFLLDLGFESFSHFSRSFKAQFGVQPSVLLKTDLTYERTTN